MNQTELVCVVADTAGVTAGKSAFMACRTCHSDKPDEKRIGPSFFGVVGRPSASLAGYTYSAALKGFNQTWTPDLLDKLPQGPSKLVPRTKMSYPGVADPTTRGNIIAYLQTLK